MRDSGVNSGDPSEQIHFHRKKHTKYDTKTEEDIPQQRLEDGVEGLGRADLLLVGARMPQFVSFLVNGKRVFTSPMCSEC